MKKIVLLLLGFGLCIGLVAVWGYNLALSLGHSLAYNLGCGVTLGLCAAVFLVLLVLGILGWNNYQRSSLP